MAQNEEVMKKFAVFPSAYMGLVQDDGALELYDGQVRLIDAAGEQLEQFDPCDYLAHIGEHVEPFTYLKFPFYKKAGWPTGVYRVGPLGRLNVATHISTPLAQEEMKQWKALGGGKPVEGTLYYHYARLIELVYALERLQELLIDPIILSDNIANPAGSITGAGVGCLEAPRGTLFHHYWTDKDGIISKVNLIVATGHNNWAMNEAINLVAQQYVNGANLTEGMLNRVEAAIRAHDPCLSCSTHAVGKMPICIQIYDASGNVANTLKRDS
jgi:NAD-reducing hydrogenase large subunit